MLVCRKTLARRAALVAVAAACLFGLAGTAAAIGPPTGLSSNPSPSQSPTWAFTWTAPAADDGYQVTGYQISIDGRTAATVAGPPFVTNLSEGAHTIGVSAIETWIPVDPPPDPAPETTLLGPAATIGVRDDRTPPTIRGVLNPASPNGGGGWYRSLRIDWVCGDTGSGVASCPPADTIGDRGAPDQGPSQVRTGTAVDRVGLPASAVTRAFNFDAIGPRTGEPQTPSANARIGAQPTFRWSSGGDATSGLQRYEILATWAGRAEQVVASVAPAVRASPSTVTFPERTPITWRVRTYDVAGNSTTSFRYNFTVDSTVPAAPTITAGPPSFTNQNAPTFSWTGTLGAYAWSVSLAGAVTPVQQGEGGTNATLAPLPDGDYTFQVVQKTPAGVSSDEATRSFQVDTVAPPAPAITARPSFPTALATPSFAWTAEEAAVFRWQVVGPTGANVQGPNDTPLPSATIGAVTPGAFSFRVWQIDPAGNVSAPTTDPFSVVGPVAGTQQPSTRTTLPRLNASKLFPRAGTVVKTRTPTLRWKPGGKGTTLYNLQLFKVIRRPPGKASVVRKVFTAFPRKTSIRLPAAKMTPGSCYVWRIWPYMGKKFTPKPLGISNFCVAKASVLKKAAKARAKVKSRAGARHSSARVH